MHVGEELEVTGGPNIPGMWQGEDGQGVPGEEHTQHPICCRILWPQRLPELRHKARGDHYVANEVQFIKI